MQNESLPRPLPPGFTNFFSLSSDCDGLFAKEALLEMYGLLRDKLQFPISDSTHLDQIAAGMYHVAPIVDPEGWDQRTGLELLTSNIPEYLNFAHRGLVDTLHGFTSLQSVRLGVEREILEAHGSAEAFLDSGLSIKNSYELNTEQPIVDLVFPSNPEWPEGRLPRLLNFKIKLSNTSTVAHLRVGYKDLELYNKNIVPEVGTVLGEKEFTVYIPLQHYVDNEEILKMGPASGYAKFFNDLKIVFTNVLPEKGTIEVIKPTFTYYNRNNFKELADFANSAGLNCIAFTSHGGGPIYIPLGYARTTSSNPRIAADIESNIHYLGDALDQIKCEFRNSFHNTCRPGIQNLEDLVQISKTNDGDSYYEFTRFTGFRGGEDEVIDRLYKHGDVLLNPSLRETIPAGIIRMHELIEENDEITGALFYTHVFASARSIEGIDPEFFSTPLSAKAISLLTNLRDSHFGSIAENQRRFFVAPQSVILRISQMYPEVKRNSWVGANSYIDISSWKDEVTGDRLPRVATNYRELRYICFPVPDVQSARLAVDGVDVPHLLRFPNTIDNGGGFVAVADVSTPRPLIDLAWRERVNIEDIEGASLADENDCLNVNVTASLAKLTLSPKHFDCTDMSSIGMKCDTATSGEICCTIEFLGGAVLRLERKDPRHSFVLEPLFSIDRTGLSDPEIKPCGLIKSIHFDFQGVENTTVQLKLLAYQDSELPPADDDRHFLSGRVLPTELRSGHILCACEGLEQEAKITPEGYFVLPQKLRSGYIASVTLRDEDGQIHLPATGKTVEVIRHRPDIVFV